MLNRRNFMLASLATACLPGSVTATMPVDSPLSWTQYLREMKQLASAYGERTITQGDMAARGVQLLRQLETTDDAFQAAVHASWESGNRFWLWQRLTKDSAIKGGILTIERDQDVPLHDHPGATGMVRVLTGEDEVWQFDRAAKAADNPADHDVLELASHRVMQPGDIAVLSPDSENIHALRAHSKTCSMLDYFIPPYERSERTWYLPVENNWHEKARIACESISEDDFYYTS
jgi:predicted metal-dependent enzyme (double-stranded beta helix superfamily)